MLNYKKTILLTGASGFIGSYFIDKYSAKYNIDTFSFLNDNLEDLNLENTDTIIHLSALVHQMGGASEEEYEKVNVTQTIDLAKKAKEGGVKHFIFMSTVKVYGEETSFAYTESSECNPQDDYGKSKLKAEQELLGFSDEGLDFRVSIVRTPIVYGYGVKANIKNLINLVNKVSVLPFGKIQNKRSMVYVGNLCHLVDAIVGATEVTPPGNIYLASDERSLSTTRLCELIASGLDKKVHLVKVPFFESLLKLVKPEFHKRLYGSLEVDNTQTIKRLFGEDKASLPYSVEEGIEIMLNGEF